MTVPQVRQPVTRIEYSKKETVMHLSMAKKALSTLILLNVIYAPSALSETGVHPKASFKVLSRAECKTLESRGVITANNPVPCHRLSKVRFRYVSDTGVIKNDGELVVLDSIAPYVASLTDELLERKFYIAKAAPVEAYGGDDQASMADNNTSAFNGRAITGGSKWSLHAYGAAIDINPVQNPFIDIAEDGQAKVSPSRSAYYSVNRSQERPGKPAREGMAEEVVDLFARHGFFVWGGDWNYPIDYQHFQIGPRSFVDTLAAKNFAEGQGLIDEYISMYKACREPNKSADKHKASRQVCISNVFEAMP